MVSKMLICSTCMNLTSENCVIVNVSLFENVGANRKDSFPSFVFDFIKCTFNAKKGLCAHLFC